MARCVLRDVSCVDPFPPLRKRKALWARGCACIARSRRKTAAGGARLHTSFAPHPYNAGRSLCHRHAPRRGRTPRSARLGPVRCSGCCSPRRSRPPPALACRGAHLRLPRAAPARRYMLTAARCLRFHQRASSVSVVAREAPWAPGTDAPAHLNGSLAGDFGARPLAPPAAHPAAGEPSGLLAGEQQPWRISPFRCARPDTGTPRAALRRRQLRLPRAPLLRLARRGPACRAFGSTLSGLCADRLLALALLALTPCSSQALMCLTSALTLTS